VLIVTDHASIDWQLVRRASKLIVDTRHVIANLA
jgi:UDP-N-acetyl-D-mannosaminuronate dehydrogenase